MRGNHATDIDRAVFRAEAAAAARLDHPGIVKVHEVGSSDGQAFFSMQLVDGATLAAQLGDGPLRPREAARIVSAVGGRCIMLMRKGFSIAI